MVHPGPLELQPLKKSRRSNGGEPWRHWEVTHLLTTRHDVHDKMPVWKRNVGVNWLLEFHGALEKGARLAVERGEVGAVPWTRTPDTCRGKLKALEAMHHDVIEASGSSVSGAAGRDLSPDEIAGICPYYEYLDAYLGGSTKVFCLSESGPQAGETPGIAGQPKRKEAESPPKQRKARVKTEHKDSPTPPSWWKEAEAQQLQRREEDWDRLEGILGKFLAPSSVGRSPARSSVCDDAQNV